MNLIIKLQQYHDEGIPNMVITGHEINRLLHEIAHDVEELSAKITDYK
jgi:hypothetical protein